MLQPTAPEQNELEPPVFQGREMPLVSVITPVFNAARWLPETLKSVQSQTLNDWEHILVDDGSSDDSCAIIEDAARLDPRIRLLRMERNGAG